MNNRSTGVIAAVILLIAAAVCYSQMSNETPKMSHPSEILIETDCAFAAMAADSGLGKAFTFYAADSATILRDGSHPIVGKDVIEKLYSRPSRGTLTWEPYFADIGHSSDLGYTLGNYQFAYKDSTGSVQVSHGYYVTIWKKQPDGNWRYVLDTGVSGPEEKK